MTRAALLVLLWLSMASARAAVPQASVFVGGWAYDISGTYTNTSRLDLEDDLGLRSTARQNYALALMPGDESWWPAIEFDYVRIAADGQQRFTTLPIAGVPGTAAETVVDDRTNVNDFELTLRYPYRLGAFTLLGGFTVTHLDGSITAADENNGQQQTQKISETFPLVSIGLEWQPVESLRLSLSGDYIRYDGNSADELEARLLWKLLGPLGLELGYRQRRYDLSDSVNQLDARVAGARLGVVMEVPF